MARMIDLVHEAEWRWADLADVLARIDADGGGADGGPTRAMLERLYGSIEHTCVGRDQDRSLRR